MSNNPSSPDIRQPLAPKCHCCYTILKNIIRILLYSPLVLLVLLALLLGTQLGSRSAVFIADLIVPNLDVHYQSGQLNKEISLTNASWSMDGISVKLDQLTLGWEPSCLLKKQLCVYELKSNNIIVDIQTSLLGDDSAPIVEAISETDELITLPFGIVLTFAELAQVEVTVNDMAFNSQHLTLNAQWLQDGIVANHLTSHGLYVSIPLDETEEQKQISTATAIDTEAQEQSPSKTKNIAEAIEKPWVMAKLPRVFMPIPVTVNSAILTESELKLGSRSDHFSSIELKGSYKDVNISLNQFDLTHSYGSLELKGQMALERDYPLSIDINADIQTITELPHLQPQTMQLTLDGGFDNMLVSLNGISPLNFNLQGDISLSSAHLPFSVSLTGEKLGWPFDKLTYRADDFTLNSTGDINHQTVEFNGTVDTPFHTPLMLNTKIKHNAQNLQVIKFNGTGDIGSLYLNGVIDYVNGFSWDISASTKQFKLDQITTELFTLSNSVIDGGFNTKGMVTDEQWQFAIDKTQLEGKFQGFPFELEGDFSLDNSFNLIADELTLTALQSILKISGTVKDKWQLTGELFIPELSLWHGEASGSIEADIDAIGSYDSPQIVLNADIIDFNFQDIIMESSSLQANYFPFAQHQLTLALTSHKLSYGELDIDNIALSINGNQQQQALALKSLGDLEVDTFIQSNFQQDEQILRAKIASFVINSHYGEWNLDSAIDFRWEQLNTQGEISPFCLQNRENKLCLSQPGLIGKDGSLALLFDGDIGQVLKADLPENLKWTAPTQLNTNIQWQQGQRPTADLSLTLTPGSVHLTNNSRKLAVNYKQLQLQAKLDSDYLTSHIQLSSDHIASLDGKLSVTVSPEHTLAGELNLHKIHLNSIAEFLPQLSEFDGLITSNLTIAGTLSEPEVSGQLQLQQGQLQATANPTLLKEIDLLINLSGKQAQIDGKWLMGKGLAKISGGFDWREKEIKGEVTFNGDKLSLIQPPLAIIEFSPQVEFDFSPQHLNIVGDIEVTSGKITIAQLPEGGVPVSSDVVFNDSLSSPIQKKSKVAITTNVDVIVHDKLRVDGMGLMGRLVGKLDLRQDAFRPPQLYGDIRVIDGSYKFMGQTLTLNSSELQFIGPMAQPNLNIEAVREIKEDDVIAGVRVTGTPQRPIVTLFSSPTKEHAEILSYIIKGSGFNSSDGDQNSGLMMGAALSLGNQLGNGTVNNIGNSASDLAEKIGFSNVQMDTNDNGRVAISGFIGEDLMVKYGVGVFNPGYEITVRYYLLSQLYLESVSGTLEQTLDIYYNFNID